MAGRQQWGGRHEGFGSGRFGCGARRTSTRGGFGHNDGRSWQPRGVRSNPHLQDSSKDDMALEVGSGSQPPDPWAAAASKENRGRLDHWAEMQSEWVVNPQQGEVAREIHAPSASKSIGSDVSAFVSSRALNVNASASLVKGEWGSSFEAGACFSCGSFDHLVKDCPSSIRCFRCGRDGHGSRMCPKRQPWEFIAPVCGTQCAEQAFFFIENVPNANAIKERSSLAMITVVKGVASTQ
ncbi:uncharacterized protein LOC133884107 [Phragmites australis]|uniref:uncharacterized protein LOC133884107 n=1 Tax=Phragmites australis TaxID=29695 RepID=UPI002D79A14A|nr:uncharacterized protein LOC133884107 [Phragmites australis]